MKPIICFQKKDGSPDYREMTEEEIVAITPKPLTNEDIKKLREEAYRNECDLLFIAYQAYKEEGENRKANTIKAEWKTRRDEIKMRYPYN